MNRKQIAQLAMNYEAAKSYALAQSYWDLLEKREWVQLPNGKWYSQERPTGEEKKNG